ncbi:MAG: hypothetical protein CMI13_17045 [Oleibacter sp.]|nr:hypothetical protein [Thalassolituus sp.]|tara:strand:+ start:460 stop:1038 length:579 start_codon:yes stop_codon:yes gene_type:complete
MKNLLLSASMTLMVMPGISYADSYRIDSESGNSFISFKLREDGHRWVVGRFNQFEGDLQWDATQPENTELNIAIDSTTADTNSQKRDKTLRGKNVFDSSNFPHISFSTSDYQMINDESGRISGTVTLHGVSKDVSFPVQQTGIGFTSNGHPLLDFQGMTVLHLRDFGIHYQAGNVSDEIMLEMNLEGVWQSS